MVSESLQVVVTDYNVAFKRDENTPDIDEKNHYDGVIVMRE
jgi:hypothetical protein|tara:strand:- start:601 stop:723 length:123 start_codon:yes stop_codon:yes gene_type:complete